MATKEQTVTGAMKLLPAGKGKCQICAVQHAPSLPHNAQSLYYQVRFSIEHKRAATWADAIAHCAPKMQRGWKEGLIQRGAWTEPPAGVAPISEPVA